MPATRTESLQRTDRAGPGPRAELRGTTQAGARRARYRTMHDSLTSLPNRSFFRQRTDGALAHSEPQRRNLTVLYLDLDGFKQVNLETAVGVAKARQVAVAPEDSGRPSVTHLELLRSSSNLPQSLANARFLPFGTPGNCGF